MGWTTTYKPAGTSVDSFFDKEFAGSSIEFVGKGCLKNLSEYYRACYNKKTNTYFALVCRIHFERDSYYNFSYKDMDESENPYFYNCPKRIMDIIERSQPINEYAKKWRAKVHKVLDTKLSTGNVICFKNDICFGSWHDTTFKYLGTNKFLSTKYHVVVSIPKWKEYDFKEIVS